MKVEVNITKKYVFMFLFSVVLIAGIAVVYAIAPNPGHDASSVGPGTFAGLESDVFTFVSKLQIDSTVPQFILHNLGGGKFGTESVWRFTTTGFVGSDLLRVDKSNSPGAQDPFAPGAFSSPLMIDSNPARIGIGLSNDPSAVLHVNAPSVNYPVAKIDGAANTLQNIEWYSGAVHAARLVVGDLAGSKMQLWMAPDNGDVPADIAIENGAVTVDGKITAKRVASANGFDGPLTSPIYLPVGSWCGWTQGATKTLCGGLDPFVSCPTGAGYTFEKRTIIPQNGAGISVCVRTA